MGPVLFVLALILFAAAAVLWAVAGRRRAASGLPRGRIVYVDSEEWQESPPMRAPKYGLVGRPDYLLRDGGRVVPVEAKPSREAEGPYESDLLQLAAYCLLVEETYGAAPPYGLLVYRRHTFEVPFDEAMRAELLLTLQAMRQARHQANVPRSHNQAARCTACSMRGHCGQEAL